MGRFVKMRKSKEAARWDAWYEKQETTAAPQEIPQELTRLPSPPQTMLDVGCGTGEMVRFWAGRQVHATGLDISKNAIRRAVELTSPLLFPFCQWTAEDWKTTSLTDRGWNSAFDLVYSAMGPDMTNMDNLRKLTAASRRYVRLLVFKDGYNSVLQNISKTFCGNTTLSSAPDRTGQILALLNKDGYTPSIKDIRFREIWAPSLEIWEQYIGTIFPSLAHSPKFKEYLLSLSEENLIPSETTAIYSMMTWTPHHRP